MTDRLPFGQLTGNLPNGGIFQDQFKVNHVYSGEIILAFIPAFQAASDFHSRGNSVFAGLESTCARLRGFPILVLFGQPRAYKATIQIQGTMTYENWGFKTGAWLRA